MELTISLQPKQREALQKSENRPVLFYGGAKGGGKSYLVRARELKRRLQYPNTKGLILRKTYPELLSNHIRNFFKEYPQTAQWYVKTEKAIHYPNGSITEFSYLQHTDDVYNYQGREYDDISMDEVTQHSEEVFKILRSSNRTTNPDIKATMFLTGNPGGIGHAWAKRIFIDRDFGEGEKASDFEFVPAKVSDNKALLDADPEYISRLEALPEKQRRAYLEGDWDIFEGQYFPEWRVEKHTTQPFDIPKHWERWIGFDWGYSAPSCALWFARDPNDRVYVYRELYERRLSDEELGAKIKQLNDNEQTHIIADPSIFSIHHKEESGRETSRADIISDKSGLSIYRANNDRLGGWQRVRDFLKDGDTCDIHRGMSECPNVHVFKNCRNLIRTLPQQIYDEKKVEDLDTTGEDHAVDAFRYGLMAAPENTSDVYAEARKHLELRDSEATW